MKKNVLHIILTIVFVGSFFSCAGMRELQGTAAPSVDNEISDEVPMVKKYKAPQNKIIKAVEKCYEDKGVIFETKDNRITTEPVLIEKASFMKSAFGGSSYYVTEIIEVGKDGQVKYFARFNKSLMLGVSKQDNLKYPEKEKELRAELWKNLDSILNT